VIVIVREKKKVGLWEKTVTEHVEERERKNTLIRL